MDGLNLDSYKVADLLSEYDLDANNLAPEVSLSYMLMYLFVQVPDFFQKLTGVNQSAIDDIELFRGRQNKGDVVAQIDADASNFGSYGDVVAHIELKSAGAALNWSNPCYREGCRVRKSQIAHMLEDGCPIIIISPPRSKIVSEKNSGKTPELNDSLVVFKTWSEVSKILRQCRNVDLPEIFRATLGLEY